MHLLEHICVLAFQQGCLDTIFVDGKKFPEQRSGAAWCHFHYRMQPLIALSLILGSRNALIDTTLHNTHGQICAHSLEIKTELRMLSTSQV